MKRVLVVVFAVLCMTGIARAQADKPSATKVLTLEQALQIALSENVSVRVADMEIEKTGYARKGSYASLFPQIDGNAAYQRAIKKQVMYMDFDMSSMMGGLGGAGGAGGSGDPGSSGGSGGSGKGSSSGGGIEVGRWNTWSAGLTAAMPLLNAQLWQSLKISDQDVELAIEKARNSRIEMVTQVKKAFFGILLAKEAFNVYKSVYENAVENLEQTQRKYNAQRASELDLARAKTALANAIPNVYDAESSVVLAQWQLKAVMGVDLDEDIDAAGSLGDYSGHMLYDIAESESYDLKNNSTIRQLGIQAEELANAVKLQKYAALPSLALAFSYSLNAMENNFKFNEYQWSPYSYVGLSLSIPIFAGGKRYHAIKQAKVQASELAIQRVETERQLKIAIRQSLNTMETQMKSYASAQSAMESARKAYDIAARAYSVGRSTLTDLNDAQLALTQAQLSVCQSIYSFVVAKASLEGVLGADFIDEEGKVKLNNTYSNE